MNDNVFRRFPRTCQEAFGPYTDFKVEPMPPTKDETGTRGYYALVVASLVSVLVLVWS